MDNDWVDGGGARAGSTDGDASLERDAVASMVSVKQAIEWLRVVATVSTAIWIVAVISSSWSLWQQLHDSNISAGNTVLRVISSVTTGTWGFPLVAVIAYAASAALEGRRGEMLVRALDEDERAESLGSPADAPPEPYSDSSTGTGAGTGGGSGSGTGIPAPGSGAR